VALYWIRKYYNLTVDWNSSAKIMLSTGITGASTYLVITQLSFASWIRLIVGVIVFVLILLPSLLLTRTVTKQDLDNLRVMTGGLGPLKKTIDRIFVIIERVIISLKL
jgi:hypothetical protein